MSDRPSDRASIPWSAIGFQTSAAEATQKFAMFVCSVVRVELVLDPISWISL